MDQAVLKDVVAEIHRRFPETAGIQPRLQRQQGASSPGTYVLTFHSKVKVAGSQTLPRSVRVVVTEQGKIIKTSTSR